MYDMNSIKPDDVADSPERNDRKRLQNDYKITNPSNKKNPRYVHYASRN